MTGIKSGHQRRVSVLRLRRWLCSCLGVTVVAVLGVGAGCDRSDRASKSSTPSSLNPSPNPAASVQSSLTNTPRPRASQQVPQVASSVAAEAVAPSLQEAAYRLPAGERTIAVGDLHGDFDATLSVLKLAGAIDERKQWVGEKLTVVQTGDQLDRGDGERRIIDLFTRLEQQAKAAGGRFIVLSGNHEVMNVAGDFRYVTQGGFREFDDIKSPALPPTVAAQLPPSAHGRAIAFLPGGPYARVLAERQVVAQVGDTVFVHGGLLEKHIDYGIERINRETSDWMRGVRPQPSILASDDAPIWSRQYSTNVDSKACGQLARVLLRMGAKRMVVGHTIQPNGISSACNDRIWRIDVGMADHYGSPELAALEVTASGVRVLRVAKNDTKRAVGQ